MILIDTHAHLNDEKFSADWEAALDRAQAEGVEKIINFGDTLLSSQRVAEMAKAKAPLYAGVGVHPEEAFPMGDKDDYFLAELAQEEKVIAIGEIGLDYYWEKEEEKRELQRKIFVRQLNLAKNLHLPVCIHSRDAQEDTLKILKAEAKGMVGVLHCFSGSYETAKEVLRLGFFIGVDGPLTFKNAAKLPEIVQKIPRDMLLLETDCPYMAPVPHRGKRNEPAYLPSIAQKVADLWGFSLEEVANITTQNAFALYKMPYSREG